MIVKGKREKLNLKVKELFEFRTNTILNGDEGGYHVFQGKTGSHVMTKKFSFVKVISDPKILLGRVRIQTRGGNEKEELKPFSIKDTVMMPYHVYGQRPLLISQMLLRPVVHHELLVNLERRTLCGTRRR